MGKFKMCCWPFPYCSFQMFLYFQCLLLLCSFSSSWVSLFVITNEEKWSDCYIQDWTSDNPQCLIQSHSHFLLFFLLQLLTLSLSDLSNTSLSFSHFLILILFLSLSLSWLFYLYIFSFILFLSLWLFCFSNYISLFLIPE